MNNITNKGISKLDFEWKKYDFVFIPIIITILIYFISLFYGFRNFDEDGLIKDFYAKKTFGEYVGRFLLLNAGGVSAAHGFTFSGIKNTHVCILGLPSIYLINFLFQVKPFLYHLWGLFLHCLALFFFIWFCFNFTQNKQIALFSGLVWSIHPTNVESVIWATNWLQPLGVAFYFFTLNKIIYLIRRGLINQTPPTIIFIMYITVIQILFTEHTITIPFAILFTIFYLLKSSNKEPDAFKQALKISLPSFAVIGGYWILRTTLIAKTVKNSLENNFIESLERILFFTPQIFLHQLKLIFFPLKLTIDQIDLLTLDKTFLGSYNLLCIFILISFLLLILFYRNKLPFLSFGLLLYLVTISLFIQIIPLYSLSGERYNYLGSAFIIFGTVSTFANFTKRKFLMPILMALSILLSARTIIRINDWKDSSSLFSSTIKTSKSLFKKGIWTYNSAICQEDENKKSELLKESTNILKKFVHYSSAPITEPRIFKTYELDRKSILAKAFIRIATNYEILKNKNLQLKYLLKALKISRPDSQIRNLIYKNLGTLYFQMNDFKKAISYYAQSNLIYPNPTINFAIAACYLKLKDFTNYEKYLKEAVSKISSDGEAFKTYGQLLELSKGDYQSALKYYKIATLLQKSPEPYILLATTYLKLRDIDNAFKTIKNGLYGFSEDPTLLYLHSTILINKGDTESGLKGLIKVTNDINAPIDIRIESCNILVNIFSKRNNLQEAKKYNDLALNIDPKNQESLKNRAILMIR